MLQPETAFFMLMLLSLGSVIVCGLLGKAALIAALVFINTITLALAAHFSAPWGIEIVTVTPFYVCGYFATDALSEFYGRDAAKKAVTLSLILGVVMTCVGLSVAHALPTETTTPAIAAGLREIFTLSIRFTLAYVIAIWVAQRIDVFLYHFWGKKTEGRHMWMRNMFSTPISLLIDYSLYGFIALYGIMSTTALIKAIVFGWVLSLIITLLDTPFLYGLRYLRNKIGVADAVNEPTNRFA